MQSCAVDVKDVVPSEPQYVRTAVLPVTGHEHFIGMDATVLDFWQWAVSDLRMNTTRSMLAEYFATAAVGSTATKRIEWDSVQGCSRPGPLSKNSTFAFTPWA